MSQSSRLYAPNPSLWRRILSGLYGGVVNLRLWLYRVGLLRPRRLPARVVSVGNLTVGGTGKTPTVIMVARTLQARGCRVAVISRGYQGKHGRQVSVVSDGQNVLMGPGEAGDEAYLIAGSLPGVPVLVGRDRWSVGRMALDVFQSQVLLMDDGFQHLALARDVNLLLLDAEQPWGNGHLLPAGALREKKAQAARATAFLVTRVNEVPESLTAELQRDFPDRPVFLSRHEPVRLVRLNDSREMETRHLKGRRVLAFCGLARPMTFLQTLLSLGADVALFIKWPDHYQPRGRDLRLIEAKARELGVFEAVTTAKDAVKLAGRSLGQSAEHPLDVWTLDVEIKLLDGQDDFTEMLLPLEAESTAT